MNEAQRLQKERDRQNDLAKLRGLRPIDDDFMRCIFRDKNPDEMHFDLLRDTARYYKENPKGVDFMCRAFEEVREEANMRRREQKLMEDVKSLMETLKLTANQAMDALKVPETEQPKYLAML